MNDITLSVIIPCFNSSSNIDRIINSLSKTKNGHFEVIFIDDGSADDTYNIIKKSIDKNDLSNFFVYKFKNSGAAVARDRGLGISKGKYVFFIDSDDEVSPLAIDEILSACSLGFDILYFTSVMRLPNGNLVDKVRVDGDYHFSPSELMLYLLNKNQWTSAVWTFVFRKELVMISQACFTKRVAHEDHLFTMRLISASNNIICIPDVIYIQNVTNGSLTNSEKSASYLFNRFDAFHEVNKDASYEYSLKIKFLYYKWSLISFIDLCINNKRSAFGLIFIPRFWFYIFRYSIPTFFVFLKFII